jgi:hypothetical protein
MRDTERLHAETNCFADTYEHKHEKHFEEKRKRDSSSIVTKKKNDSTEVSEQSHKKEKKIIKQELSVQKEPTHELSMEYKKQEKEGKQQADVVHELSKEPWTNDMVDAVITFLKNIFAIMELDVPFAHTIDGLQLRITFERSLYENKEQEYKVFTSLAFLMLQMIKREFKKKCKGYRVVFGLKESIEN